MAGKLGEAKSFFQKKLGMGGGNTQADLKECHSRMSAYNVLMEGTLAKKGDLVIGKSWKSRYFMMVSPRVLFYFDEKGKADTFRNTPTSMMDIAGKQVTGSVSFPNEVSVAKLGAHEGQSNVFTIKGSPSDKRTWYLAAPNAESMELWIRAIKEGERFTREPVVAAAAVTPVAAPVVAVVSTPPPAVSVAPAVTPVAQQASSQPQPQPQQQPAQPTSAPQSAGAPMDASNPYANVPPSGAPGSYPPGYPGQPAQPQQSGGQPQYGGAPSPQGGYGGPTGGPSSPTGPPPSSGGYGGPNDGSASVSMNMGGPGMMGMPGMNMSISASGSPNNGYGGPNGAPSGQYGSPSSPPPQGYGGPNDGSSSVSMNMGGGPNGMPMGMNMSVTATGGAPSSGQPYGAPQGGPSSSPPTGGAPGGPQYGSPTGPPPSSGGYGGPNDGSASVSMNMGGPGMMGMPGMNMTVTTTGGPPSSSSSMTSPPSSQPYGSPPLSSPSVASVPRERDVIEQMFNMSNQIQMNAKSNLARIRDLITQTSLPGSAGVAPASISMSIGGMPHGAAIGVTVGGYEPGMQDPKSNPKFPLNVRKNCREAEVKWFEKAAEIKNSLGRDIQLLCNWEHWYAHEKMDTYKKDNLGTTIYENYMCAWAEGFISFSQDVDNLDAFRMALTVPIIHIKLGWDKAVAAKQKAGYCQQYFADGRLYIQINPGYLGSGIYELSDGKYIANAL